MVLMSHGDAEPVWYLSYLLLITLFIIQFALPTFAGWIAAFAGWLLPGIAIVVVLWIEGGNLVGWLFALLWSLGWLALYRFRPRIADADRPKL